MTLMVSSCQNKAKLQEEAAIVARWAEKQVSVSFYCSLCGDLQLHFELSGRFIPMFVVRGI
jgi:hypothetical protein